MAALCARFDRTLMLPLTDLAQKYGPQRIALSHLLMQVVAVFGHRRVIVGAAVLAFDWALTQPGVEKHLALGSRWRTTKKKINVVTLLASDRERSERASRGDSSFRRDSASQCGSCKESHCGSCTELILPALVEADGALDVVDSPSGRRLQTKLVSAAL